MGVEKRYYEDIMKWLEKRGYFIGGYLTDQSGKPIWHKDVGIKRARVDVLGIRNLETPYSDQIEIAAVEVKDVQRISLKDIYQTFGYSLFAHRCYLANTERFGRENISDAERYGIGLLRIYKSPRRIRRVLSPKIMNPDKDLMLQYLARVGIVECSICRCYFFWRKPFFIEGFTTLEDISLEELEISPKEFEELIRGRGKLSNKKLKQLEKHGKVEVIKKVLTYYTKRGKIFSALASKTIKDPDEAKKHRKFRTLRFICGDCYEEFFK